MKVDRPLKVKTLVYGTETVQLHVDMGVGIGGDKWPAAELFAELVMDPTWKPYFAKLFQNKVVLELGAGTGLNSILIDHCFSPKAIIVTDHESHVELINKNLEFNKCSESTVADALDWCNLSDRPEKCDVVMAFECIYKEELYEPFISALENTTNQNSVIIIGLTRAFCKPFFFEMLRARGFQYTMLPQESLPRNYSNELSGRDVGLFICKRI